jgi:Leucine-rich repeat (LRR) protein
MGSACSGRKLPSAQSSARETDDVTTDLSHRKLQNFDGVTVPLSTTSLLLDFNAFRTPGSLKQFTHLTELSLAANELERCDCKLLPALSLRSLNLGGNKLYAVPDLPALTRLVSLYLQANALTSLPDMTPLSSLLTLDVAQNQLGSHLRNSITTVCLVFVMPHASFMSLRSYRHLCAR